MEIKDDKEYIRYLNYWKLLKKLPNPNNQEINQIIGKLMDYEHAHDDDNRVGSWIPTISGKRFWILDPRPEEVLGFDIAYVLSRISRFNGMTIGSPYYVAQHLVEGTKLIEDKYKLHFALHDAPEAYVQDITTPLKRILGKAYNDIEAKLETAIANKFNIQWTEEAHKKVKEIDHIMLMREMYCLTQHMHFPADTSFNILDYDYLTPWDWRDAFAEYRNLLNNLLGYEEVPLITKVIPRDLYERG